MFSTFSTSSVWAPFPSLVPETLFSASVVLFGLGPDAVRSGFSILLTPQKEQIQPLLLH